jgi:hypothetical protein
MFNYRIIKQMTSKRAIQPEDTNRVVSCSLMQRDRYTAWNPFPVLIQHICYVVVGYGF